MAKKSTVLISLVIFSQFLTIKLNAQEFPWSKPLTLVHSTFETDSHKVELHFISDQVKQRVRQSAFYHWYEPRKVMKTQGGYHQKLLHSYYREFYKNGQLKYAGTFRKGLKNGIWKKWDGDGELKEMEKWKRGEFVTELMSLEAQKNSEKEEKKQTSNEATQKKKQSKIDSSNVNQSSKKKSNSNKKEGNQKETQTTESKKTNKSKQSAKNESETKESKKVKKKRKKSLKKKMQTTLINESPKK